MVVIDKLGLLGARQFLELMRLQKERGFQLVGVGDPKQCQSIEAGPLIDLLHVPEILTLVRQVSERERETALLFRDGCAADALALKRADQTARLVPGDYREAVECAAALWRERRQANAHDPDYELTVSAPTNADARAIGAEIRKLKRSAGALSADRVVLQACDQNGASYELPLAVGERVRLFDRVNASFEGRSRDNIGNNGSALARPSGSRRGLAAGAATFGAARSRRRGAGDAWRDLRAQARDRSGRPSEPMRELARSQTERLAGLRQAVSSTWRAVLEIGPEIQSTIQQAAARLSADPKRIMRHKAEEHRRQEFEAIRARLLRERMGKWRDEARRDWSPYEHSKITEAREAHAKEAEAAMKAAIAALPDAELRTIAAQWKLEEAMRRLEQNLWLIPKRQSPSPGI